jgi:hypothetical protein
VVGLIVVLIRAVTPAVRDDEISSRRSAVLALERWRSSAPRAPSGGAATHSRRRVRTASAGAVDDSRTKFT